VNPRRTSLRTTLDQLTHDFAEAVEQLGHHFAEAVLRAVRSASLIELADAMQSPRAGTARALRSTSHASLSARAQVATPTARPRRRPRAASLPHHATEAAVLAESALNRSMLPKRMTAATPSMPPPPDASPRGSLPAKRSPTADGFEPFLLALRAARGNVTLAAASLGISRARAYRLLEARPGFDLLSLRDEP